MNKAVYNYHMNRIKKVTYSVDCHSVPLTDLKKMQSQLYCKSTLTTAAYKGNRVNKTPHNTELKSPKLTQQSLWKAGPAFTQR